MKKSVELLKGHPINKDRIARGLNPANCVWFWGEGRRAELENFTKKTGLKGTMISAVDLLKGIAKFGGMDIAEVEGATGYIDTNFKGKAQAALDALANGSDFVYVHMEAPDEMGHQGAPKRRNLLLKQMNVKLPFVKPFRETIAVAADIPVATVWQQRSQKAKHLSMHVQLVEQQ